MPGKTHIVIGHTGEYEDRRQWFVAAFWSARRAATYARRANEWLVTHGLAAGTAAARAAYYQDREDHPRNPYDPDMSLDYTGTSYSVVSVRTDPPLPTKAQGA